MRILEAARAGDQRAFGQLLRQHDDRMRALAWKLLGDRDRMDDALQEAYMKAWRSLGGFREDADFGTWLYRITYNACIDELRRAARRPVPCDWSAPGEHPVAQAAGPEHHAVTTDATARALASLPEEQRAAVVLVYGEGFDNQTAADLLGVAVGTIASRLSRARASLRARLVEEDRRELMAVG